MTTKETPTTEPGYKVGQAAGKATKASGKFLKTLAVKAAKVTQATAKGFKEGLKSS